MVAASLDPISMRMTTHSIAGCGRGAIAATSHRTITSSRKCSSMWCGACVSLNLLHYRQLLHHFGASCRVCMAVVVSCEQR